METKEIIDNLAEHFLKSDPKEIALALAGVLVDFHRMHIFSELDSEERASLIQRMELNEEQFIEFVKYGPKKSFRVVNWPRKDDQEGTKKGG